MILEALDDGFFNETTFKKYVDIWNFKPEIYEAIITLSQDILTEEYKKNMNKSWNSTYKEISF